MESGSTCNILRIALIRVLLFCAFALPFWLLAFMKHEIVKKCEYPSMIIWLWHATCCLLIYICRIRSDVRTRTKDVNNVCSLGWKLTQATYTFFKGQCHEIFWNFLFHESKPSGPLINSLKCFCFKIRFCEDICKISDSTQANTAQSPTLRRLTLCRVRNWNVCKSKIG